MLPGPNERAAAGGADSVFEGLRTMLVAKRAPPATNPTIPSTRPTFATFCSVFPRLTSPCRDAGHGVALPHFFSRSLYVPSDIGPAMTNIVSPTTPTPPRQIG